MLACALKVVHEDQEFSLARFRLHFRDYHLLLDEHADAIFTTIDALAERVHRIGGTTLGSIGHIARLQGVKDNDAEFVAPIDMLPAHAEGSALSDRTVLHGPYDHSRVSIGTTGHQRNTNEVRSGNAHK